MESEAKIIELSEFRDKISVFRDRNEAGEILADMMRSYRDSNAIILAIPAGGVPVAYAISKQLALPLDVAVTSKITLPWNTEAGYGAVAFDGTVKLNQDLISRLGLTKRQIQQGINQTLVKVQRRIQELRGSKPMPEISKRPVILVDDGLASGFTILTAVSALRKTEAEQIIIAVPTAHRSSLQNVIRKVDVIYCPNIRGGWQFAVAEAYQHWSDVEEEEVKRIFKAFRGDFS
jgi:predicted phosphoribosyltransferase